MQSTTLSFHNMHNHGVLLTNLFRARHESFIEHNKWDLPNVDGMEFDQYDTPASRWIAVHDQEEVLAGIRLTPTTHRCGIYTYMIRDAQLGLLDTIPDNLLYDKAPVAPHIWESSRIFVSRKVPANKRMRVQMQLVANMVTAAREVGASTLLGLVPANGLRWGRRIGQDAQVAGPIMTIDGSDSRCIWINIQNKMH